MSMLKTFAPVIAFTMITSASDWRLGLVAGLLTQIIVLLTQKSHRVGILDGAMLAFFAVVGVFAVLYPSSGIQNYVSSISMAWLALVTVVSIAVGHPFTLDFSAPKVSAEIAHSSAFIETNRTITWAWAKAFAGIAIVGSIATATDRAALGRAAAIVMILAAIKFTTRTAQRSAAQHNPARIPASAL